MRDSVIAVTPLTVSTRKRQPTNTTIRYTCTCPPARSTRGHTSSNLGPQQPNTSSTSPALPTPLFTMQHASLLLLRAVGWFGLVKAAESACVELTGIASGGGDGTLDLDVVSVSLEKEPFALSNALITTIAGCSSGLETPVSIRNLLCESAAPAPKRTHSSSGTRVLLYYNHIVVFVARSRVSPVLLCEGTFFVAMQLNYSHCSIETVGNVSCSSVSIRERKEDPRDQD